MAKDAAPARRRITAMVTDISTSEKPLFERLARKDAPKSLLNEFTGGFRSRDSKRLKMNVCIL